MTAQLQQAIKLLALSNLELETFVGEALEANPLLEAGQTDADASPSDDTPITPRETSLESSPVDRLIGEGRAEEDRPLDIHAGAVRDDLEDFAPALAPAMAASSGGDDDGDWLERHGGRGETLAEHLHAQVGAATRDAAIDFAANWLIDQLDEAGYLPLTLAEASAGLGLAEDTMAAALALIQSLDPTGVGARDLAECLALQAREVDRYDPCMARLIDNLELVARGSFAQLKKLCAVDDEDFAEMLAELRSYDPKPGLRFSGHDASPVITPDLIVSGIESFSVSLNEATLPKVAVNRGYYRELRGSLDDKAARGWLSDRLADANWLLKALEQRQRTILKVAREIVRRQEGFFRHGVAQLRPLTLKAVAEAVCLHESTVSRVTSNKFLHCARGTFELKYFFTSSVAAADGDGSVSSEAVKAAIRQLIEAEDAKAILSDDALVELLRQRGFDLARRTVAKYREAIGLGSSVQRRRQKALASIADS